MAYEWILQAVEGKPGVEVEYKEEWGAHLLRVAGKMFGMLGEYKDGRPILTLKLEPLRGDFLRGQNEDIIPGYYMNKTHYNSVFLGASVPKEEVLALLEESYTLVFGSLSAKKQRELGVE